MKFSYKILFWTIIIMAAAFGVGGYIFVDYVFDSSLEREVGQAMDETSILQFAFETAAINIPSKYDVLQNSTIEEIGYELEKGQGSGGLLRISDEEKNLLYSSEGFTDEQELLERIQDGTRIYQVIQVGEHYYVQTGTVMNALDRILYLEIMKDVTTVFEERTRGFAVFRKLTLVMLFSSSVVMLFISFWLTRPIRLLTKATRKMAAGDYAYRAKQISNDEMGLLTCDFNVMANSLEENIHKLENEIRAREDFIAAFSHELKTPLTAIIGYADLLRSRKLDDEKHFLSANYIYTEGKRLETMAFRLLDIIVMKRSEVEMQQVAVSDIFHYLQEVYAEKCEHEIVFEYEDAVIYAELNLLKTVLMNLADNAVKASEAGQRIEITGKSEKNGYRFAVRDYGVGIPTEEIKKITEAFYMVDKSRSRGKNGAGLGLALCASVLEFHRTFLEIESTLGEGTVISFCIKEKGVTADA